MGCAALQVAFARCSLFSPGGSWSHQDCTDIRFNSFPKLPFKPRTTTARRLLGVPIRSQVPSDDQAAGNAVVQDRRKLGNTSQKAPDSRNNTPQSYKTCMQCEHSKPVADFSRSVSSQDGTSFACRACTAAIRAKRSGRELHHLGMSVEEAWQHAKTCTACGLQKELRDFCRKGEGTGYRCRGCQAKFEKVTRPPTDAPQVCVKCGELKPANEYYKTSHRPNGLSGRCKACCKEIEKERWLRTRQSGIFLSRTEKVCSICTLSKPVSEFYAAKGIDGLQAKCKLCSVPSKRLRQVKG